MSDAVIYKLLHYLSLLDYGCPLGRHELRDEEWLAIGVLKAERGKIAMEEAEEERRRNGQAG